LHDVGHAVVQGIEILAVVGRQGVLLRHEFEHILLVLRRGQVGIEKVVAQLFGSGLQVFDRIRSNRLNDVGTNITKWLVHLRVSFK
jgi:hypothetical protein